jgi:hypothetical protein
MPPDMGRFHRQLPERMLVGEISAAEAREIKTLNDLVTETQKDLQHAQRVAQVVQMHRLTFLRSLIEQRGLDAADLYNIDDDSGSIWRTHELVTPLLEAVPDADPKGDDEATEDASDGPEA